jgi:hypothetical protein
MNLHKLTRNKLIFLVLLLSISGKMYAAGARSAAKYSSDSGIDRFINGSITNIETGRRYIFLNKWQNVIIQTKILYSHDGLFIVEDNWKKYIVYNEYYNGNILTAFKLNEYMPIVSINKDSEYNIVLHESNLIVIEIFENNLLGLKIEMRFDENSNRLILSNREMLYKGILQYNFNLYYEYDNFGRLESIYRNLNDEKILVKSIYYDGIFRIMPRPFLLNLEPYSNKEIVIYDNNIIKYFIQTRLPEYDRSNRSTIEEEEAEQFLLVIEYDNEGNEILQTLSREESEYFEKSISIYKLENVEYDLNNNWIKQNVYFDRGNRYFGLLETYTRIITYK